MIAIQILGVHKILRISPWPETHLWLNFHANLCDPDWIRIVIRILGSHRNPDHPKNVINCYLARETHLVKGSCKSVYYFLSKNRIVL